LVSAVQQDNGCHLRFLPLILRQDQHSSGGKAMVSQAVDFYSEGTRLFITSDDDRLVPPEESESLFAHAGEPKKLVVLKGFGHYEVYTGAAFRAVITPTLDWYRTYLPAR
jgi:hypothetical protein